MRATCYGSCCDLESTERHDPFCSAECARLAELVSPAGVYVPKHVGGRFLPPPVAPWSWLDARAGS